MSESIVTVTTPQIQTVTVTSAVATGGGGIGEAPDDGQQYARQSQGWSVVVGGGGGGVDWNITTAGTGVLSASDAWQADSSGGAISRDLPASPADGDRVRIKDNTGSAAVNNITVGVNGKSIDQVTGDLVINTNFDSFDLQFNAAADKWYRLL